MAEDYGATGGGRYAGSAPKKVSWDIGAGSARTSGSTQPVSWDIGTGANRTTGSAPATYAAPANTMSSFSSNPAPYIAPVPNYSPAPSGPSFGASPEPIAPPAPPVGGRQWYSGLDEGSRAATDEQYLAGDSDYTAQVGEYERALQTFIDRITKQRSMFDQDAKDATASTERNQLMSANSLGEDFGARGLSYSGLAVDSQDKNTERFNEAKAGIGKVLARNNQDADNREADYRTENAISRDNASRAALSRQAQRQALIDQMAGF